MSIERRVVRDMVLIGLAFVAAGGLVLLGFVYLLMRFA